MSTPGAYIDTRERYERVKRDRGDAIPLPSEEDIIQGLVDLLIARLYDPTDEGWRTSRRIEELGLHFDAINWGDLSCTDVGLRGDGVYLVTVEEAAPEASNLRTYLQRWLRLWGWNVEVTTEW